MNETITVLRKYIPEDSINLVIELLKEDRIHLRITKKRRTKLGDYRPPTREKTHRITINHDLNKYSFLITLIHEITHVHIWDTYKNKVKPHGKEWKLIYRKLMLPFLDTAIFPEDIIFALNKYLKNAKASSGSDLDLTRALGNYDIKKGALLEELAYDTLFSINKGKTFKKLELKRKRYKCLCVDDQRIYLINPLVQVTTFET